MIQRMKCLLRYHNYFVMINITADTKKVGCRKCNKMWVMNDRIKAIIPWDKDIEEFYEMMNIKRLLNE